MRALLQRVKYAQVDISGQTVGKIGNGLMILFGVAPTDTLADADYLADKCVKLRIFEDDQHKMNRSLLDIQGEILVVSQFTLYADANSGRRPSFTTAAKPDLAIPCYEHFVEALKAFGVTVQTGEFGADMQVSLLNDGPVTILLESKA